MSEVNEAFEFLVLRFRDLVTNPGGTIELHCKQIEDQGAVWWGWWKKSGETVPAAALNELSAKGTGRVLLFDSGRHRLYWATYNQVRWRQSEEIPSPCPDQTPDYYSNQKYEAWFRFTTIEEIPTEEVASALQQHTYVRRDEFFENGKSRYERFYDKIVFGCEELQDQDRTIWFVRKRLEHDRTNEVRLLAPKTLSPAHFPEEFTPSKSRNLLWVSDLHFSVDDHHAYAADDDAVVGKTSLGTIVDRALGENKIKDLAGIIVSGDITWKAHESEYEQFLGFLRRATTSPTKLDNYRIAMAPGNHDLAFSDTPNDKTAPVKYTLPEAKKAFATTYQKLFYLGPNEFCCSGRRFLLANCVAVEVVCLNSSAVQQGAGWFQGLGFVGAPQLQHVEEAMGWGCEPVGLRPFRILVLHHHLMPVVHRELPAGNATYSVTLDAEAIVEFIVKHQIRLVLHGHMHQTFFATVSREVGGQQHTYSVAGLGSTGVAKQHRPDGHRNSVGVLSFEAGRLVLKFVPLRDATGDPAGTVQTYEIAQ